MELYLIHRGSATRLFTQVDTAFEETPIDNKKLARLNLSLSEKLQTLKRLDAEIEDFIPEEELASEIKQADCPFCLDLLHPPFNPPSPRCTRINSSTFNPQGEVAKNCITTV